MEGPRSAGGALRVLPHIRTGVRAECRSMATPRSSHDAVRVTLVNAIIIVHHRSGQRTAPSPSPSSSGPPPCSTNQSRSVSTHRYAPPCRGPWQPPAGGGGARWILQQHPMAWKQQAPSLHSHVTLSMDMSAEAWQWGVNLYPWIAHGHLFSSPKT